MQACVHARVREQSGGVESDPLRMLANVSSPGHASLLL
jgi:hypothetical protein